jgi:hypothetical protein
MGSWLRDGRSPDQSHRGFIFGVAPWLIFLGRLFYRPRWFMTRSTPRAHRVLIHDVFITVAVFAL